MILTIVTAVFSVALEFQEKETSQIPLPSTVFVTKDQTLDYIYSKCDNKT